jgi:hypothetical protein
MSFFSNIYKSFLGGDGLLSHNKVYAFFGFFAFLTVSVYLVYKDPVTFASQHYTLFATLAVAAASSIRISDKITNNVSSHAINNAIERYKKQAEEKMSAALDEASKKVEG